MLRGRRRGTEWDNDVPDVVSGQRRQRLASAMRGLDLHVRVQRRPALHLHNDRSGRHVLFVLPGDGLNDEPKLIGNHPCRFAGFPIPDEKIPKRSTEGRQQFCCVHTPALRNIHSIIVQKAENRMHAGYQEKLQ